jgi:endoglucanase
VSRVLVEAIGGCRERAGRFALLAGMCVLVWPGAGWASSASSSPGAIDQHQNARFDGLHATVLAPTAGGPASAHAAGPTYTPQCTDPYSPQRQASNPLMLSPAPAGSDPLQGVRFFVDGPAHGAAAGAIARLLGIDTSTPEGLALPSFSDAETWGTFAQYVATRLSGASPALSYKVRMLEKIADQPEAQRISVYSQGGTPTGIYSQTQKLFCHNFTADSGSIPIISTYFLHPTLGGCPTRAAMNAYRPLFQAQINAMAQATGNRPAVYLLELDAIGSSLCIASHGLLPQWESLLHYEAATMGSLPHTVVYLEGGYSDSNTPQYAARILNASGVGEIEGFFTNDTHLNWTIKEIRYGEKISRLTHGAHFVINTAQNGNGPKLNPDPVTQGIEDLCNPPGRGLGPEENTNTGFAGVDAFLWTHVPGNSSGCGGGPPAGVFWAARAISLAARANGRLGPNSPSQPYDHTAAIRHSRGRPVRLSIRRVSIEPGPPTVLAAWSATRDQTAEARATDASTPERVSNEHLLGSNIRCPESLGIRARDQCT